MREFFTEDETHGTPLVAAAEATDGRTNKQTNRC